MMTHLTNPSRVPGTVVTAEAKLTEQEAQVAEAREEISTVISTVLHCTASLKNCLIFTIALLNLYYHSPVCK